MKTYNTEAIRAYIQDLNEDYTMADIADMFGMSERTLYRFTSGESDKISSTAIWVIIVLCGFWVIPQIYWGAKYKVLDDVKDLTSCVIIYNGDKTIITFYNLVTVDIGNKILINPKASFARLTFNGRVSKESDMGEPHIYNGCTNSHGGETV